MYESIGKSRWMAAIPYTLSHPENDRDVIERAQGYTLQDASFMPCQFDVYNCNIMNCLLKQGGANQIAPGAM